MSGIAIGRSMGRRPTLKRIERWLGPGAALLLGAASAFFCFAMPAAIILAVVDALGLPPALAESRLAMALGVGIAVAAATWFAFTALDRAARPRPLYFGAPEGEADLAPVLRRADAHPDAPPRRPIFAGSDLGTPLDLIDPLPLDWTEPNHAIAPTPIPAPAPAIEPVPLVKYAEFQAVPVDPHPVDRPMPEIAAAPAPPPPSITPRDPAAAPGAPQPTLAAMMARLESGLTRKSLAMAGAEPNVTALKREIRPIAGSLRAAVEELQQRTAARR